MKNLYDILIIAFALFCLIISGCTETLTEPEKEPGPPAFIYKNGHDMTADETWSGRIILKGDIKIGTGRTLTVLPGTIIKIAAGSPPDYDGGFEPGTADIYIAGGNLVSNGNISNIILFTVNSDTPAIKDWEGIILGITGSMQLSYTCIKYASTGISTILNPSSTAIDHTMIADCWYGIANYDSQPVLSYVTFKDNSFTGFFDFSETGKTIGISYCSFNSNYSGAGVSGSSLNTTLNLDHSNFSGNSHYDIYAMSSANNTIVNADNCFNITKEYGSTINKTNTSSTAVATAGCGFAEP